MKIDRIIPNVEGLITTPVVGLEHPDGRQTAVFGVDDFAPTSTWELLRASMNATSQKDTPVLVHGIRATNGEPEAARILRETFSYAPADVWRERLAGKPWNGCTEGVHLQGHEVVNIDVAAEELLDQMNFGARMTLRLLHTVTRAAAAALQKAGPDASIDLLGKVMAVRRDSTRDLSNAVLTRNLWPYMCDYRTRNAAEQRDSMTVPYATILWEDDMVDSLVQQLVELGWKTDGTEQSRLPWARIKADGTVTPLGDN